MFDVIFRTSKWPRQWQVETKVIIPKTTSPDNLADCRNISCTAFLSNVLETLLLDDLRSELQPDNSQYSGIKRCSVDHLLADLYEAVLNPLEQGHSSTVLGIDYEKAFNGLDHLPGPGAVIPDRQDGASEHLTYQPRDDCKVAAPRVAYSAACCTVWPHNKSTPNWFGDRPYSHTYWNLHLGCLVSATWTTWNLGREMVS